MQEWLKLHLWRRLSTTPQTSKQLAAGLGVDDDAVLQALEALLVILAGELHHVDGQWFLAQALAYPCFLPEEFTAFAAAEKIQVSVIAATASTNSDLLNAARTDYAIDRHLLIACHQTAGRGRMGRKWQAAAGGLFFSLGKRLSLPQKNLTALPLVVACGAADALQNFGVKVALKWPNDLMINHAKLGGILVETISRRGSVDVVIGIGINRAIPDLGHQQQAAGLNHVDGVQVIQTISRQVFKNMDVFAQEGFLPFQEKYQRLWRDFGQEVVLWRHDEKIAQGKVAGVNDDGALLLATSQGLEVFHSAAISLRLPEN